MDVQQLAQPAQGAQVNAGSAVDPACIAGLGVQHPSWQNATGPIRQDDNESVPAPTRCAADDPHLGAVKWMVPILNARV